MTAMRKGFTLIEVTIVSVLFLIMWAPFLEFYLSTYQKFHSLVTQVDLKADAEVAAARVHRAVFLQRGQIAPDNHAVGAIRWDGQYLWSGRTHLIPETVQDFSVVRRGGILMVHLALVPPNARRSGTAVSMTFDFPARAADATRPQAALAPGRRP